MGIFRVVGPPMGGEVMLLAAGERQDLRPGSKAG